MSYASRAGHCITDPNNPEAQAVCDLCGRWYQHNRLAWQFEWRGNALVNTRFLRCPKCLDVPFELNRPVFVGPDPVPIKDPRVEPFLADEGPPPPDVPVSQLVDQD